MLTIRVTNRGDDERTWNVEPFGDQVRLAAGDVLEVNMRHTQRVLVQIDLHPDGDVVWPEIGSEVPESLILNGHSLWPT